MRESSRQSRNHALCANIDRVLDESGLPPSQLEVEITESVVMHDVEDAIATLHALKATGVRVSVDDFGTGYRSLAYRQRFPIDTRKIDRSFIRDVPGNGAGEAIVETVMALARTLRSSVIAEGVETSDQRRYLRTMQCHALQGYFSSRPLPAPAFAAWLASHDVARGEGSRRVVTSSPRRARHDRRHNPPQPSQADMRSRTFSNRSIESVWT